VGGLSDTVSVAEATLSCTGGTVSLGIHGLETVSLRPLFLNVGQDAARPAGGLCRTEREHDVIAGRPATAAAAVLGQDLAEAAQLGQALAHGPSVKRASPRQVVPGRRVRRGAIVLGGQRKLN
jgi:hypothetical protein